MTEAKRNETPASQDEAYRGEAIRRAVSALDCFTPKQPRWTLSELSNATGAPLATLRGILDTLVAHSLLRHDADAGYRLGFGWLRMSSLLHKQFDSRTVALPLMRRIREAINETVILSLRVGDQRVHIDYVESTHAMRRLMHVGSSGSLNVGATGVALLAALPRVELASYLNRAGAWLSDAALEKLERDVATARRDGVFVAIGSVNAEMATVASGTRLHTGECVAMSISCPLERFTPTLQNSCKSLLREAIADLSGKLGARF